MCGIIGGVWNDHRAVDELRAGTALSRMHHRGPDAEGIYIKQGTFLGHRRLSIIDVDARANQPMRRGSLIISFNGEIYNYRELRQTLENEGVSFSTHSDTEVVLALFQKEGINCLKRLEGMFAFAIWNEQTSRLILARDKFGEKPLVYFNDEKLFAFASEVLSLETLIGKNNLQLSSEASGLYFLLTYIPAPYAPYKNMHQLEPGTWLEWDATKRTLKKDKYFNLAEEIKQNPISSLKFDDAVEILHSQLTKSVRLRLETADVPVAVFLSGGIDSSIISALAAKESTRGIQAYSIGFPEDPDFDESSYARILAKHYPAIRHTVIDASENKLADFMQQTLSALGEPYGSSSIIPTAYLCAHVEEKVILGGDGADELFAGYGSTAAIRASNRIPSVLKRLALLFPNVSNPNGIRNPKLRALSLFRSHLAKNPLDEYLSWRCYASVEQLSSMGLFANEKILQSLFRDSEFKTLQDILLTDIQFNLPNDMLKKVDLASMQHSLEVRLPYLDSQLVKFALGLPEKFSLNKGQRKHILRAAFRNEMPAEILSRRKQGFLLPIRKWFRDGRIKDEFAALIDQQDMIDKSALNRYLQDHAAGKNDYSVLLWTTYVFLKWCLKKLEPETKLNETLIYKIY